MNQPKSFEQRLDFIFGARICDEGIREMAEEEQKRREAFNDEFLDL